MNDNEIPRISLEGTQSPMQMSKAVSELIRDCRLGDEFQTLFWQHSSLNLTCVEMRAAKIEMMATLILFMFSSS